MGSIESQASNSSEKEDFSTLAGHVREVQHLVKEVDALVAPALSKTEGERMDYLGSIALQQAELLKLHNSSVSLISKISKVCLIPLGLHAGPLLVSKFVDDEELSKTIAEIGIATMPISALALSVLIVVALNHADMLEEKTRTLLSMARVPRNEV